MKKEIILPPHLYDRLKASAGEHGGIGQGELFDKRDGNYGEWMSGTPLCVHGHAWGTCTRYNETQKKAEAEGGGVYEEPELAQYLGFPDNDAAVAGYLHRTRQWGLSRIPFDQWCQLLNVTRGVEVAKEVIVERETVTV